MNALTPEPSLLAKLGSIVVHVEEAADCDASPVHGHLLDQVALGTLLDDPEVVEWIKHMRKLALIPVKRK